jgi:hypothetical protein
LCTEKLERFVESIDELLAENVVKDEPFWAVFRKYLPAMGCSVGEVISASKASRFFVGPLEGYASYAIIFKNSDIKVRFGLEKGTGNISYPDISFTHAPSW